MMVPTRDKALALLKEYNSSESLIKHAFAVEGVMRYSARKREHDEDMWGIIGLIHDLDYERFPEQHCVMTKKILTDNEWP
ncbi:MAG: hydrolase, partial [Spirochaetales bacterium]|nr:hydrolase [Spirochaetales bacterium]